MYFDALICEIKGMFRRSLGQTAHRGWARLFIDRMDTQVQHPEYPETPEPALGSTHAFTRPTVVVIIARGSTKAFALGRRGSDHCGHPV